MTEKDKSQVPEKTAITDGGRDFTLESSKLDSQAEPGTLQHVQSMKLLANQDSPSDLSLKCPELSGVERAQIQNNRFEIVDSPNEAAGDLDSATLMAITAESTPAIMPVALLRQYAESLPEGHPDKLPLTELSRKQAADLSPEFANRYDRADGSILLDIGISKDNTAPQNWFEAMQQISELPVQKQFEVIGTALSDGFKQYSYEERERTLGQMIGTVQGVGDVLQFYATISDFANDMIFRREEKLQERGAKFGEALANTYVGGVALFNLAYDYCYNIGFEGDYYKPFRDVISVANAIDSKWKTLPPREQERIKAQLITNLLADGVITARGAQTIFKLPKMTQVLDAVAVEAKAAGAAIKNVSSKVASHIITGLDEITKLPPGAGGLRPAFAHVGELAPEVVRAGQSESKGWREKFDELMNAMGGNKENLENPFHKCKKHEKFDHPNVVQQENINSCGFACIEMVTNGEFKERDLILEFLSDLPEQMRKPNPKAGIDWISAKLGPPWRHGYFSFDKSVEEHFSELSRSGSPWFARLQVPHSHYVLVDGMNKDGMLIVRDPAFKSAYQISKSDFLDYWSYYFVYKRID